MLVFLIMNISLANIQLYSSQNGTLFIESKSMGGGGRRGSMTKTKGKVKVSVLSLPLLFLLQTLGKRATRSRLDALRQRVCEGWIIKLCRRL